MPGFLDLPIEMRLKIYGELILPNRPLSSLGYSFSAVPPFRYHTAVLRVSQQISREASMVFTGDSKHPWEIYINFSSVPFRIDGHLDAIQLLPCMLHATNINFNYMFCYDSSTKYLDSKTEGFQIPQGIWSGIDHMCRALSAVKIARSIGISWNDLTESPSWATKRRTLQPLALFPADCSFRIDNICKNSEESVSAEEIVSYLTMVTGRVPTWKLQPSSKRRRVGSEMSHLRPIQIISGI